MQLHQPTPRRPSQIPNIVARLNQMARESHSEGPSQKPAPNPGLSINPDTAREIERCLLHSRAYALAKPDKYPISYRIHTQFSALATANQPQGNYGVHALGDFGFMKYWTGAEAGFELAMIWVCREYGIDPVDYWKAICSPECLAYVEEQKMATGDAWTDWEEMYAQKEFAIDPTSFTQATYAIAGPFKKQYDAVEARNAYMAYVAPPRE